MFGHGRQHRYHPSRIPLCRYTRSCSLLLGRVAGELRCRLNSADLVRPMFSRLSAQNQTWSVLTTVFSLIPLLRSLTELGSGALPSVESCHRNRFSTILRALPRVRSGYAGISQVRTRDVPFDVPFDVPVKTLGFDAIRKSSEIYPGIYNWGRNLS